MKADAAGRKKNQRRNFCPCWKNFFFDGWGGVVRNFQMIHIRENERNDKNCVEF